MPNFFNSQTTPKSEIVLISTNIIICFTIVFVIEFNRMAVILFNCLLDVDISSIRDQNRVRDRATLFFLGFLCSTKNISSVFSKFGFHHRLRIP